MEDKINVQHTKKQVLVVIGGGAAGFFTAVNAARMNAALEVVVVEKSSKLLAKVKISGGGRCNVTHACFEREKLIDFYPRGKHFLKKAFHHFYTVDTVEWFASRGVELKTESDGRMFPVSNNSQTIVDALLLEASKYRVSIMLQHSVELVRPAEEGWELSFSDGTTLKANFVCIASGGFPKAEQFQWIAELGHTIVPPVPSLFTFNMPGTPITALQGISVADAVVKIVGTKLQWQGPVLITHWGLSGPAVLKLSAWGATELQERNYTFEVLVNWIGGMNEQTLRTQLQTQRSSHGAKKIINTPLFHLPQRLWTFLLDAAGFHGDTRWADASQSAVNKLIQLLSAHRMEVRGKTTFKEEFVTAGGVDLSGIDPHTMQSKLHEGLYFAGEIMNVDGITGGFNFQHAWTSGYIAAQSIAAKAEMMSK